MNILPKKRWHVRTKDNIARVRRDEAAAREEDRKRQEKLQLAESEARINFLRKKSGVPEVSGAEGANELSEIAGISCSKEAQQNVDLFADFKSHIRTTNKELEKEKKEEREKYEKQIGYLTYLGQDTNESLKIRSWYELPPKRGEVGETVTIEKDLKVKTSLDPLTLINALVPPKKNPQPSYVTVSERKHEEKDVSISKLEEPPVKKGKKNKKEKKHKRDKSKEKRSKEKKRLLDEESEEERRRIKREKLDILRKERLHREAIERARQDELLGLKGSKESEKDAKTAPIPRIVQKYNSQFNPDIAKQNMI